MKIEFHGFITFGLLEQRKYRQLIYKWLEDQIVAVPDNDKKRTLSNIEKFRVRFFPTTMYKTMYGEYKYLSDKLAVGTSLSDMIPHEKVGQFEIDLFILDAKDDMRMASNLIMMSHGFGHVLLYSYDPTRRVELKYDDSGGKKKGKILAWHTAAVHNRTSAIEKTVQRIGDTDIENQIYYLETWMPTKNIWRKTIFRMYDFRDDFK